MKRALVLFLLVAASACATKTDLEKGPDEFMVTYDSDDSVAGAPTKLLKATNTGVTAYKPLEARQGVDDVYVNLTLAEGDNKGLQNVQSDGTAYDSTAATLNYVYVDNKVLGAMMIVDAGNTVPNMDATGLDLTAGNTTDNDHMEYFTGHLGTSGRPFVVGTDRAFQFRVELTLTDVSGSDFLYCGFRDAAAATVSMASYTDYCAVGSVSGNYGTHDKTTGATDSGSDVIADTETDVLEINVSAGGVCTYQIDDVDVASADTHTLTDGELVIPFCQVRHDTDISEDLILGTWTVQYQDAQNP